MAEASAPGSAVSAARTVVASRSASARWRRALRKTYSKLTAGGAAKAC